MNPPLSLIAFCRSSRGHGAQIFTMYKDGTGVRQLTGARGQGRNWSPSWSPDGTRLCFASDREGYSRLYSMNSDGSAQERLTVVQDAHDDWPDWARLEDKIVFSRGDHDAAEDLYVLELRAGRAQRLTTGDTLDYCPSWSPDGEFIAFRRSFADPPGIYLVPARGGEPWLLTGGYYPSWSPLGDRLAYSYASHIWLIGVDARGRGRGEAVQLTSAPEAYDRHPSWSPDGAHIAFQSKLWEGNRCAWHIMTMRADGSGVRDLGEGEQPAWSPRPPAGVTRPRRGQRPALQ